MSSSSRAREMACYSFLVVFANDAIIDEGEIAMLRRLALEDGVVDDAEKEVLRRVFARVDDAALSEAQRQSIADCRRELDV
ncbi:MAG TPA: hypothetical protein VF244_03425 [Acidimicrobiales bacterium]